MDPPRFTEIGVRLVARRCLFSQAEPGPVGVATVAVTFAAAARTYDTALAKRLVWWLSPVAGAAAFDAITRKRVHPVWLISLAVFGVAFLRVLVMESPSWLRIGRALLAPVLS